MSKSKDEIANYIKIKIAEKQGLDIDLIDDKKEFYELGLDSIEGFFILRALEEYLGIEIDPLTFWDNPSIETLSTYLKNLIQSN